MNMVSDIIKKAEAMGYLVHQVLIGPPIQIEILCATCRERRLIKYRSLWHKRFQCLKCAVCPNWENLQEKLSITGWTLRGTKPTSQTSKLDLQCPTCNLQKIITLKSFLSRPLPCRHLWSRYKTKVEANYNQMGFALSQVDTPASSRKTTWAKCRRCNTRQRVSLRTLQAVGGCPECQKRGELLRLIVGAKTILDRNSKQVRLICQAGHDYKMSTRKIQQGRGDCPVCAILSK